MIIRLAVECSYQCAARGGDAPPFLRSCDLSDEITPCFILFYIGLPQDVYLGLRWVFFFFLFQRFSNEFGSVLPPLQIEDALGTAWDVSKVILWPILHSVRFCFGLCLLFYGMAFRTLAFHIIVIRLSGLGEVKKKKKMSKYILTNYLLKIFLCYFRQSTYRKLLRAKRVSNRG